MNKKTKIIVAIAGILLIVLIYILMTVLREKHEKKVVENATPSFEKIEDDNYLIADGETMSSADEPEEYVYRVALTNMGELADTGIQSKALDYIEPYLNEYLNYYVDTGVSYEASYIKDTYEASLNFPQFKIYIEDLDLEIECMYITSAKYYRFNSRFNPEWQ